MGLLTKQTRFNCFNCQPFIIEEFANVNFLLESNVCDQLQVAMLQQNVPLILYHAIPYLTCFFFNVSKKKSTYCANTIFISNEKWLLTQPLKKLTS